MMIMPHNSELEHAVLYGCIRSVDVAEVVMSQVEASHFYKPKHTTLYKALKAVFDTNHNCDISSVTIQLEKMGELQNYGGEEGILSQVFETTTYSTAESHLSELHGYMIRRKLIGDAQDIIANAVDNEKDPYALADYAHKQATELTSSGNAVHTKTVEQLITEFESLETASYNLGDEDMTELIYKNSGCQPGHVEVTIAESGHGKTRYAMYKTGLLAQQGYRTHWFQMEDYGGRTAKQFKQRIGDASENIVITTGIQDIEDVKREARKIKREFGTHNIVIDYVQEVSSKSKNRAEEIEHVARQCTGLAMDLGVNVHLTSQMTITDTARKKWALEPRVNDVRWSKQLKQAAHLITSVFRPGKVEGLSQSKDTVEDWGGGTLPKNIVVVRAIKDRYGEQSYKPLLLLDTDDGLVNYKQWQAETYEKNNAWRDKTSAPIIPNFDDEEPF